MSVHVCTTATSLFAWHYSLLNELSRRRMIERGNNDKCSLDISFSLSLSLSFNDVCLKNETC